MYSSFPFSLFWIYILHVGAVDATTTSVQTYENTPIDDVKMKQGGDSDHVINICVLVPFDDAWMFSLHRVLPAVTLTVAKVKDLGMVNGLTIRVRVGDTQCNSRDGPIAAFNLYMKKQVSVFIGPTCDFSLAPVARYAPVWNLPVISPGGFAHDMVSKQGEHGEFPSLTRIGVTFNSLADSIISIMMGVFRWNKLKVVYDGTALSNITPRFCYLAASSLINTTKVNRMHHSFHMFLPQAHTIEELLLEEIGVDNASESNRSFVCLLLLFAK